MTFGFWGTLRCMAACRVIDVSLWIIPNAAKEAKLALISAQLCLVYTAAGDTEQNAVRFIQRAKSRLVGLDEKSIRAEAEKMKAEVCDAGR